MDIRVKRVYERPATEDGYRILVDRLWPRGVTKEEARIDLWLKDIAPSPRLRAWFGHEPDKWLKFKARYAEELKAKKELLEQVRAHARRETTTLLFAAAEEQHNNAVALKEHLEPRPKSRASGWRTQRRFPKGEKFMGLPRNT